jgi:hypothetical protein
MLAALDARGPVATAAPSRAAGPKVCILVVDGFDRSNRWGDYSREEAIRYPWIDLCLSQVDRHTRGWDYEVLVYDNAHLPTHRRLIEGHPRARLMPGERLSKLAQAADRPGARGILRAFEPSHPRALDRLLRRVPRGAEYVVTLDSDSFPIRDDWLEVLVGGCESGAAVAGVYRDEMAPRLEPFVHVSGLCARLDDLRALPVSFNRGKGQDVGKNITDAFTGMGREVAPLRRSNRRSFHFLIGGIYGDVVYHHGAGSRHAGFWTSKERARDERVRTRLRDAVFADLDRVIAVLRGEVDDDLGLPRV